MWLASWHPKCREPGVWHSSAGELEFPPPQASYLCSLAVTWIKLETILNQSAKFPVPKSQYMWNDLVRRSFSKAKGWDVVTSVAIWERQPLQAYRILLAHIWAVESGFLQVLEKHSFELLLSHTEFFLVHTKGVNIGSDMQPAANFIQLLRSQRRPNTHDCNLQIVPVLWVLQQWDKFGWIPGVSAGRLTGSLVPGKVLHGNRRNPSTKNRHLDGKFIFKWENWKTKWQYAFWNRTTTEKSSTIRTSTRFDASRLFFWGMPSGRNPGYLPINCSLAGHVPSTSSRCWLDISHHSAMSFL